MAVSMVLFWCASARVLRGAAPASGLGLRHPNPKPGFDFAYRRQCRPPRTQQWGRRKRRPGAATSWREREKRVRDCVVAKGRDRAPFRGAKPSPQKKESPHTVAACGQPSDDEVPEGGVLMKCAPASSWRGQVCARAAGAALTHVKRSLRTPTRAARSPGPCRATPARFPRNAAHLPRGPGGPPSARRPVRHRRRARPR